MEQFAKPGDFCPYQTCPDCKKLQIRQGKRKIIKSGKTQHRIQRFRCKTCGKYFVETSGTIFYRKRTPKHEILETLVLLAEGNRISSVTRVKRHKEDTILSWLREAARHTDELEDPLRLRQHMQESNTEHWQQER